MQQEKEEFYNMMKETGELHVIFEGMTGDWQKDKVKFCTVYDDVMDSLKGDITNDSTGTDQGT